MYELFTDRARQAVSFAAEEAAHLGEKYVGTETLLLGLIREADHGAARVLDRLNVSRDHLRTDIERQVVRGHGWPTQHAQLSVLGKQALDLAHDEARLLSHGFIGTGHVLLGLIRQGKGLAAHVLERRGVELEPARRAVAELQHEERLAAPRDDVQQLIATFSKDRGENEARLIGVLHAVHRAGEPWWLVPLAAPFRAEALLAGVRAEGFPDAEIAGDDLIWVRPIEKDELE